MRTNAPANSATPRALTTPDSESINSRAPRNAPEGSCDAIASRIIPAYTSHLALDSSPPDCPDQSHTGPATNPRRFTSSKAAETDEPETDASPDDGTDASTPPARRAADAMHRAHISAMQARCPSPSSSRAHASLSAARGCSHESSGPTHISECDPSCTCATAHRSSQYPSPHPRAQTVSFGAPRSVEWHRAHALAPGLFPAS